MCVSAQECVSRASAVLPSQALAQAQGQGAVQEDAQRRLLPREEKRLLLPLLRLRQACCHPQVCHSLTLPATIATCPTLLLMLNLLVAKTAQDGHQYCRGIR